MKQIVDEQITDQLKIILQTQQNSQSVMKIIGTFAQSVRVYKFHKILLINYQLYDITLNAKSKRVYRSSINTKRLAGTGNPRNDENSCTEIIDKYKGSNSTVPTKERRYQIT